MSSYILQIYSRLIADICELSKVPLGAPDDITYDWVLIEGPKLDKTLLMYIEGSGLCPEFPEWLMPLWTKFESTMDPTYLKYIRQCLLFCYKIEHEPTNEQLKASQEAFENTEEGILCWESYFTTLSYDPLFSSARRLVSRCIYKADWGSIHPQHGPGAVYPPRKPWCKGDFRSIYSSIERYYPYGEYLCGIPSFWKDVIWDRQADITVKDTIECRLVAVPKDSRGPRLICVHPAEAIWIQQGCRKVLEKCMSVPSAPCYGRISFHDQSVNGKLALSSSLDREYCTLDLKEASDRISCKLVEYLFGTYCYERLSCSRASHVRLLDDRVIPLRKWAPMGNCLTFPVQSLIFYSVVRAGIHCRYGTDCRDVYVFGDDIIFPSKYYDGAVNALIRAGMVPNQNKTFRNGFFRESCGVDAYRGKDVTPHRLRRVDVKSVSGAMSVCALAKALSMDGYHRTSNILYRSVQDQWGTLPLSNNPNGQGLYRFEDCSFETLLKYEDTLRFNVKLHRWETKLRLVEGASIGPVNDAWWHLQEGILKFSHKGESIGATRGLEYTVPHRERLKRGWIEAHWYS